MAQAGRQRDGDHGVPFGNAVKWLEGVERGERGLGKKSLLCMEVV